MTTSVIECSADSVLQRMKASNARTRSMASTPVVLTFGNRLSALSWVDTLRSMPAFAGLSMAEWRHRFDGNGVVVDLSTVRFADFVALGRVLNLVNALAAAGAKVVVRLPNGEPLVRERTMVCESDSTSPDRRPALLLQAARWQRQRYNCRLFMRQAGFERALIEGPWDWGDIVRLDEGQPPSYDTESEQRVSTADLHSEGPKAPQRLRRILPYQWIKPFSQTDEAHSDQIRHLTASLTNIGLSSEDATTLAQGILTELIENVAQHALDSTGRAVMALVGGLVVEPETYSARVDDFSAHLRTFVRWSARVRSPLVRLVVADTGAGLPSPGSSARSPEIGHGGDLPGERDPIHVAFDRWSGPSRTLQDLRHPARGLWKVARIIRSFPGSILVSTAGWVAGYVFDDSGQPKEVAARGAAWIPGTLIECDILAGTNRHISRLAEPRALSGGTTGERPRLVCSNIELHTGRGLTPRVVEQLQGRLTTLSDRRPAGLVISVDAAGGERELGDAEIRRCLVDVLGIANTSRNPAAIVVVFTQVSRQLLSLAIDDLNLEHKAGHAPGAESPHSPILVLAQGNRHHWAGGAAGFRRILSKLSSEPHAVPLEGVASAMGLDSSDEHTVGQIQANTGWLALEGGAIRLAVRPEDALNALADDLGGRLARGLVEANVPGVERGRFLTPSLRVTTRWFRVGAILSHLRAKRLAGLLLATRVENRVGPFGPPTRRLVVLRVGDTTHEMTCNFARALTGDDFYHDSVVGMDLEGEGATQSDEAVVLFADLISTTKSVYREFSLLKARGISPVAVVTVLDGRPSGQSRRNPNEIMLGEVRLPLVSLAVVDLEIRDVDEVTEPIPIDPVSDQPSTVSRARPRALVLQPAYLEALARTGGARLGHIQRPGGRHYTAYVDPTVLFSDRTWANHVMSLVGRRIEDAHRTVFGTDVSAGDGETRSVGILFPSDTNDDLQQVAWLLASELGKRGLTVAATAPVPRAVRGTKWRFPATVSLLPNVGHVVVIDSGTVSGRSVQQLVRIASEPGVRAVTAVILLNGLNDLDAIAVQQVRTVDSIHMQDSTMADPHRYIAVNVHFVARTAMYAIDSQECPVCLLRSGYKSIHHTVPASIDEHRTWLLKTLALRSKERAFAEEPTDLIGMPISQEDCIEYLRWRSMLREAQHDTTARHDLMVAIHSTGSEQTRRNALVRLLAAEWNWLDTAPLWWPDLKRAIAEIALSMIAGSAAWDVDRGLRIQAINLLVRADPSLYVTKLVDIFLSNSDERLVLDQLIIETLLLVSQMDRHTGFSPRALVESLTTLDDRLREFEDEQRPSLRLEEVRYLFSISRRILHRPPTDPQAAWKALRRLRGPVMEHAFDAPMWRLEVTLANLSRGLQPWNVDSAREDWERCSDFLGIEVFPCLEPLRNIMLSMRMTNGMGADGAAMWARVVNGDGPILLDETRYQLRGVLVDRPDESIIAEASIEQAATRISWWSRFFLGAHPDPDRLDRGAFLTELVNQCPAPILDIARAVFENCDCDYDLDDVPDDDALRVFCASSLVRDVLTHVRVNAESRHRRGEGHQRFAVRIRGYDSDFVDVIVRNTDSSPSNRFGGRGLTTLRAELARFGAELSGTADVDEPWTYQVSIRVRRWEAD